MKKPLANLIILGLFCLLCACTHTLSSVGNALNPYSANHLTLDQSVQAALIQTNDPQLAQVHVEARQKDIRLTGYVKKIRQSDTAEQIARQVPGVANVENHIIVKP